VEVYWEQPQARRLEQRQAAGREPLSERRSVEQPGYLGVSLLRLHRHRAPIMATRPTGTATQLMVIPPIGTLLTDIRGMDTHPTHSRAMDTEAIRVVPVTSLPRPMSTKAMLGILITLARRAMNTTATRGTPLIPVPRAMDHLATWETRLTPARRATNTRAMRLIRPRLVLVLDIPSMAIPAIML
jgi:hypothetical protein